MKNKKLFAILTLVCFMFTLMPVAAFAADTYGYIEEDYTAVDVYEDIEVKVTTAGNYYVYVVDANGDLYNKVLEDKAGKTTIVGDAIGATVVEVKGADSVKFQIKTAGEYTVGVAKYSKVLEDALKGDKGLVDSATLLSNLKTFKVDMINNAVSVAPIDVEYAIGLSYVKADKSVVAMPKAGITVDATSGFNKVTVIAKLTTKDGKNNIPNATLDLKADSYAVTVTPIDAKTRADGTMRFTVAASVPGNFNVYVDQDAAEEVSFKVAVDPATIDAVATLEQPAAPVDVNTLSDECGIVFVVTDSTGYVYESALVEGAEYKVAVVDAPKGFSKTATYTLTYDATADVTGYELTDAAGKAFKLDKEGTYTFKVSLKNGSAATASVTVEKFDEAVALQFHKAPATVVLNGATQIGFDNVKVVDANGVVKAAEKEGVLKLSVNGSAVDSFAQVPELDKDGKPTGKYTNNWAIKVKDDDKYIGSKITVIAVLGEGADALTATTEITVVEEAAAVRYTVKDAEVGVNAKLEARVFDENGKFVALPGYDKGTKAQVIVLDKPENAIATVANAKYDAGKLTVGFLASAPGEYKIQTIITTADSKYISGIETITVGGGNAAFKDVVVVSMGANSMIVNNELVTLDVAPFIENNRTMMQFNVLYVFGIDVEWVAETQSIVAEGNGLKVVMQLGSKVATVNGEEVALDVAPYSVNGRTVVPVGFITGLLDITPTFTYNADGTIADILFTK